METINYFNGCSLTLLFKSRKRREMMNMKGKLVRENAREGVGL